MSKRLIRSMLKKTDLSKIKQVATNFIYIDIIPDDLIPGIVHHPFISNNFICNRNPSNSQNTIMLLFTDTGELSEPAYNVFVTETKNRIEQARSYFDIFALVAKAYKSAFLLYSFPYLDKQDLGKYLKEVWISCDYVNIDKNISRSKYSSLFKKADKHTLMDDEEYEVFKNMPETIILYRGVNKTSNHPIDGMSWTRNFEIAVWFAKRLSNQDEVVYVLNVPKEYVLAYFSYEEEYVVDYQYLKEHKSEITVAY